MTPTVPLVLSRSRICPEPVLLAHAHSSSSTITRPAGAGGLAEIGLAVGAADRAHRQRAGRDGQPQRAAQVEPLREPGDQSGVERVTGADGVDDDARVAGRRIESRALHRASVVARLHGKRAGRAALDHDARAVAGEQPRRRARVVLARRTERERNRLTLVREQVVDDRQQRVAFEGPLPGGIVVRVDARHDAGVAGRAEQLGERPQRAAVAGRPTRRGRAGRGPAPSRRRARARRPRARRET